MNNARALLGCQDEKMQTLEHFFGVWPVGVARFLEEGLLIIESYSVLGLANHTALSSGSRIPDFLDFGGCWNLIIFKRKSY